jgi:hypothetical protein
MIVQKEAYFENNLEINSRSHQNENVSRLMNMKISDHRIQKSIERTK